MSPRYLLGLEGAPIVPPSWQPQDHETSTAPIWSDQFRQQVSLVEARRRRDQQARFDFLGEIFPGGSEHVDVPLWRFVLRKSTWVALRELGISPEDRLQVALPITWKHLEPLEDGVLAGLDLVISAESWGPVALEETASLDAVRDHLLLIIGRDGGPRLSERDLDCCLRRSGWGTPPQTLDAIGRIHGVTRERIRQIISEAKWSRRTTEHTMPVDPALSLDALLRASDRNWVERGAEDFLTAVGQDERLVRERARVGELRELGRRIAETRGPLGFVDCRSVRRVFGIDLSNADIEAACSSHYAFTVRSGDWIACGTAPRPYGITVALAQFRIADTLPAEEIHEGVLRQARSRDDIAPPVDDLVGILTATEWATADGTQVSIVRALADRPTAGEAADWLFDLIHEQPDCVAHRDVIMEERSHAGIPHGTISVYLTYHHLIRPCGQGCYRVVGSTPSAAAVERAARFAALTRQPTRVHYDVQGVNVTMEITCGTTFLSSGVISVPVNVRGILLHEPRPLFCCGERFGNVRISESGLMFGFAGLIQHREREHGMRAGEGMRISFDDDAALAS